MTLPNPSIEPADAQSRGLTRIAPWLFAALMAALVVAGLWALLHFAGRVREHQQLDSLWTEAIWLGIADIAALLVAAALSHLMLKRPAQRQSALLREQMRGWQVLEAIADCSPDAIYAKDTKGRNIFVNREVCRLLGKSREQLQALLPSPAFV